MLTINKLCVAYGPHAVLDEINLQLAPGEVLGVIGPNGAGKTSLIRAISGVLKPRSGSIHFDGQDLNSINEIERARLLAVVQQSAQLPPAFTVWECVALGRTPYLNWLGQLGAQDRAKVAWALGVSELAALKDRRAGELSGGEQQRILLARALAQNCPILLLDEPTAHLDLHHQVALLGLVARMVAEQRLAVLLAMHDLNLAALYADRLALLVNGKIEAIGTPAAVLTAENLQNAYQVPLNVLTNPHQGLPLVVLQRN